MFSKVDILEAEQSADFVEKALRPEREGGDLQLGRFQGGNGQLGSVRLLTRAGRVAVIENRDPHLLRLPRKQVAQDPTAPQLEKRKRAQSIQEREIPRGREAQSQPCGQRADIGRALLFPLSVVVADEGYQRSEHGDQDDDDDGFHASGRVACGEKES